MPFTDPMADGPAIQRAGQRALEAGQTMDRTLAMVRAFREADAETPLVLMGYYNPIYSRGVARFLAEAKAAGVDGLIIVDLPPEEDDELCLPAQAAGIDFVRLATPTTDDRRLPRVLQNTSGFVYYVSITGITGSGAAERRRGRARGRRGSRRRRRCRSASASASGPRRRPPASPRSPTARWSARRSSSGSAPARASSQVLGFVRALAEAAHAA